MAQQPASTAQTDTLTRNDWILAALLGVAAFIPYWLFTAPGLLGGDSGEFQLLALMPDNAHSPGYAVYLLLAKLFTLLPLGANFAFRVNLFSAFMGAMAAALLYLAGRMLTTHRAAAALGAAAFAVSGTIFSQATIAEVYTSAAAFLAAVLLCMLMWERTGSKRALFAAGVVGGLSLWVHFGVGLVAPAAALLLLLRWKRLRTDWLPALAGAAIGLILAVGIFLAVDANPTPVDYFDVIVRPARSDWNLQLSDLDSPWERLWFMLTAKQFQSQMFQGGTQLMQRNARWFAGNLPAEFSPFALLLALGGLVGLFLRRWRVGGFFIIALIFSFWYITNYDVGDLFVFFYPVYVLLALLLAAGAGWLLDMLSRCAGWVQAGTTLILFALCLAPVVTPRLADLRQSGYRVQFPNGSEQTNDFQEELRHVIRKLPENAILFTDWGKLYSYYYVALLEENRPDLFFLESYVDDWDDPFEMADSDYEFIRENFASRPIFFSWKMDEVIRHGYGLRAFNIHPGMLYRLYK